MTEGGVQITCLNCDGTGRSQSGRGWAGGASPDGTTCFDCQGTGVDTTPYGVGSDHCPYCATDWKQPHDDGCPAAE